MTIDTPSKLSDAALVAEIKRLAGCERDVTVHLIVHLGELDARQLYLGLGFSSLFMYCTKVLALSEQAAYHRIVAARAARRFPPIVAMLGNGSLNLSTLRILAPHLTRENHAELLGAALGKSKREVDELVAGRFPQADRPASVRRPPARPPSPVPLWGSAEVKPTSAPPATPGVAPVKAAPPVARPSPSRPPAVTPRAEDRYGIRFTATRKTCDKLWLAQDAKA